MTTTTLTTHVSTTNGFTKRQRRSYLFSQNIYQVEVNGEDGDYITFEVTADSCAEAAAVAENMAQDSLINISYINVMMMN